MCSSVVALVSKKTSHDLGISSSLLTVLGTVLGLVISFRTSTAYERCVACDMHSLPPFLYFNRFQISGGSEAVDEHGPRIS